MISNNIYWMNYSINIAEKASCSKLHVGVVLISDYNELICSAFSGEIPNKSSFFDIKKAILEVHRVLKPNSVIIISIANGFLYHEHNSIIPGLIIPATEFVDIYRRMDTIKIIYKEFIEKGFKNINIFPTNTEIYLSAVTL